MCLLENVERGLPVLPLELFLISVGINVFFFQGWKSGFELDAMGTIPIADVFCDGIFFLCCNRHTLSTFSCTFPADTQKYEGIATHVAPFVITGISQRGKDLFSSLLISSSLLKKLTLCISFISRNLLIMKSDFVSVRFVKLIFDINFKLNKGSKTFKKELNWYSHRVMSILDAKQLTAGVMKFGMRIGHPYGRIIVPKGGVTSLVSV